MQKLFVIISFVFLSSIAVAAQTSEGQKALSNGKPVEFAKRVETERTINTQPAPVSNVKAKTDGKRSKSASLVDGRVIRFGPRTTYLKEGLTTEEVLRLLGKPSSVTERREGNNLLSTYTFQRSEGRIFIAEFENGLLVRSRTEPSTAFQQSAS